MVIIFAYVFPAIWAALLFAQWMRIVMVHVVLGLPAANVLWLDENSNMLIWVGVLTVLLSHCILVWEVTANRKFPRHLDELMMFTGLAVVTMGSLAADWSEPFSVSVLGLLVAPNFVAALIRAISYYTNFLWGSVVFLFILTGVLTGFTLLTWPNLLG